VPGVDDDKHNLLRLVAKRWNRRDVHVYPLHVGWKDGGSYESKLQKLLALIDVLSGTGQVAVVGVSAGASLAMNAYAVRPRLVGVVNVCGTLRFGRKLKRSLAKRAASSPAYRESVLACELAQQSLTTRQRRCTLVLQPFYDGIVPLATMTLPGARLQRIVGFSHVPNIATALVLYRSQIVRFLKQ
jgi:pimeloyl-ACP methyl ester carboxylesterase